MDIMQQEKMGPSDFKKQIDQLKAAGKLPSLSELTDAVSEIRKDYRPKILKAREQGEQE
jgi:hypothetical protein